MNIDQLDFTNRYQNALRFLSGLRAIATTEELKTTTANLEKQLAKDINEWIKDKTK